MPAAIAIASAVRAHDAVDDFIGPTGVGKTGLASGLLLKAIQSGYRARFIRVQDLFDEMYASLADRSTRHLPQYADPHRRCCTFEPCDRRIVRQAMRRRCKNYFMTDSSANGW